MFLVLFALALRNWAHLDDAMRALKRLASARSRGGFATVALTSIRCAAPLSCRTLTKSAPSLFSAAAQVRSEFGHGGATGICEHSRARRYPVSSPRTFMSLAMTQSETVISAFSAACLILVFCATVTRTRRFASFLREAGFRRFVGGWATDKTCRPRTRLSRIP